MIIFVVFFLCFDATFSASDDLNRWINAVTKFEKIAYPLKGDFSQLMDLIVSDSSIPVTSTCRNSLTEFSRGLQNSDHEAMALFDSFSKIKPGQLTSRGYNYGAYDQCLDHGRYLYMGLEFPVPQDTRIRRFPQNSSDWKISWSYTIGIRRRSPYHFAICTPNACAEDDIVAITDSGLLRSVIHPLTARVISSESRSETLSFKWTQITAMIMLLMTLMLGCCSAAMNSYFPDSSLSHALKPFDVIANAIKLLSPVRNPESMAVIGNAYRSGYCLLSVLIHLVIAVNAGTLFQRMEASESLLQSMGPPVTTIAYPYMNAAASLMSFHILTMGCFTVIRWLPVMVEKKVSLMAYCVERVVRTLPVVVFTLIIIQAMPFIPHGGPLMRFAQQDYADICLRNGWRELLFVNNFLEIREICLPVAWIISAEFQLYVLFFVVLTTIAKYPKHAVKIMLAVIILGWIVTGAMFSRGVSSTRFTGKLADLDDDLSQFTANFYHSYNHISPYAIGMLMGLKLIQGRGIPKPVGYLRTFYSIALLILTVSMLGIMYDEDNNFRFGPMYQLFLVSITRTIGAAVIAVFYYTLFNTRHPLILAYSRSRFAATIARMSLSFFLMHIIVAGLTIASYENSDVSVTHFMREYLFVAIVSLVPASLMFVFVEEPFAQLYSKSNMKRNSLATVQKEGTRSDHKVNGSTKRE